MTMLTITAKGQVTLRQDLLKHLGVSAGQKIEVDKLPNGGITVKAAKQKGAISDFIGCMAKPATRSLTVEDMNTVIAKGWAGKK